MAEILEFPTRKHTCDVCVKTDVWGDSWSWTFIMYKPNGEYRADGYEKVFKMCSRKCQEWADKNVEFSVNI